MADEARQVVALDVSRAWSAEAHGAPVEVEVLEGSVLVTMEGDPADHVLGAGERFFSLPRGRVAATGLAPSRVGVQGGRGGRVFPAPLAAFARIDVRRLVRHALGAALVLAVWLSLWVWVATTVARPALAPRLVGGGGADVRGAG